MQRSPTYSHLQQKNADGAGWGVGWEGRGVTRTTSVCLTHSVEKSLHSIDGLPQLQAYNTGQTTPAIRLHSRPLLVGDGKAVLQLSVAEKNFDFSH